MYCWFVHGLLYTSTAPIVYRTPWLMLCGFNSFDWQCGKFRVRPCVCVWQNAPSNLHRPRSRIIPTGSHVIRVPVRCWNCRPSIGDTCTVPLEVEGQRSWPRRMQVKWVGSELNSAGSGTGVYRLYFMGCWRVDRHYPRCSFNSRMQSRFFRASNFIPPET